MKNKITELIPGVYYIPSATNIGLIIVKDNTEIPLIYLIDSGSSEIDGEFILDILYEEIKEYTLRAILTTHGHPDHTGGHKFLKDRTGCEIWASKKEKAFVENPELHGSILWGSYPPRELRSLYFKPEAVECDRIISKEDFIALEDGRSLTFFEFQGHSPQGLGILIENHDGKKVLFAGDAIFPRNELGKHWIHLITNPMLFMDSLDSIATIENLEYCIPSHGEIITDDLQETIEMNKIAILSTRQCILNFLKKGKKTGDEIIKYVADYHGLTMKIPQYTLISSTIKSYLAEMQNERKVDLVVEENLLYYSLRN